MDIIITGRNTNVTDDLKDYVHEKIGSSAKVFNIKPMEAEVVLREEKNPAIALPFVCEVTLRAQGNIVRVTEAAEDMNAAIDLAADKVTRQLRKFKTKIIDRKHRGESRADTKAAPMTKAQMDKLMREAEDYQRNEDDALVREKVIDFMDLTVEEALVQTDLIGHNFFVFNNKDSGETNVIYKRHDGGYGILKPKTTA